MPQRVTLDQEQQIIEALTANPHASQVARDTGWSFSTVWRVAQRAGIELTAGRRTMGRHRLSPEQRARVIEARRGDPKAPQQRIAKKAGVSRSSVWRIERGNRGGLAIG
jgi:DNA-binding MurR/RpiR family transcriptional regulator